MRIIAGSPEMMGASLLAHESAMAALRSGAGYAVLCVPRQSAMDLSDELVRLGIQGFWNFSHYDLSVVYPQVTVENVHLGDSLMSLGYRLRSHDE